MAEKKKVLVLGSPLDYVDKEYLDKFKQNYQLDVSLTQLNKETHIEHKPRFSPPKTARKQSPNCPPQSAPMAPITP